MVKGECKIFYGLGNSVIDGFLQARFKGFCLSSNESHGIVVRHYRVYIYFFGINPLSFSFLRNNSVF